MHVRNAVMLVWGSVRLAPIGINQRSNLQWFRSTCNNRISLIYMFLSPSSQTLASNPGFLDFVSQLWRKIWNWVQGYQNLSACSTHSRSDSDYQTAQVRAAAVQETWNHLWCPFFSSMWHINWSVFRTQNQLKTILDVVVMSTVVDALLYIIVM